MKLFFEKANLLYFLLSLLIYINYINANINTEIFQTSDLQDFQNVIEFNLEEEKEIIYLPPEPVLVDGKEVKVGLTISFPVIGEVTLYPEKDENGKEVLKATLKDKSIKLDLFDMVIDNFSIFLEDNKIPKVSADVTLFGKKGTLELLEVYKESQLTKEPIIGTDYKQLSLFLEKARFRIKFIDKFLLEILPLKNIDLNYIDLILEKNKQPILTTGINILGTVVQLSFSLKDKELFFEFLLPKITLGNFFQELENSQFNNVTLNNLSIKVFFKYKENQFIYKFSGFSDFSNIKLLGIEKISLDKLEVTGSYSKADGLEIDSNLANFLISGVSEIEKAKFTFYSKRAIKSKINQVKDKLSKNKDLKVESLEKGQQKLLTLVGKEEQPLILISGNGNVNLPKIGKLDFDLNLFYASTGLEVNGIFEQSIDYGQVKINNAQFELNSQTKSLLIKGDSKFYGFDLSIKLLASPDSKDPNNKIYQMEALVGKKDWTPFASSNLPTFLKNLLVKNLSASVDVLSTFDNKINANLVLNGDVDLIDTSFKAQIRAISNAGDKGLLLRLEASSNKLPAGLNKLPIEKAYFLATSIEYKDIENNITYEPNNLTLVGKVNLTGILEPIGKLIGNKEALFNIVGHINPVKIEDSKLSVQLSKGIPVKTNVISIGPVSIDIGIKNEMPVIDLNTHLILRPNFGKDNELDFSGIASVSPIEISGQLRLDGMWQEPFGLKNIEIGDLSVALGINPQTFPETLLPSKFDLGGRLQLSPDKVITLAIAINFLANQLAFLGSLESKDVNKPGTMSLKEIVTFLANRLGANIPENNVPVLEIQDPKFSFASKEVQVGAIKIPMGITLKGKFTLLNQILDATFGLSKSGVVAKAAMTPVILGPLKLSAGKTINGEIRKTKYNGPEVDIELTLARQNFLINCLLELDSIISGSGDMHISKDGITFNFEVLVGPDKLFSGLLKGQSYGSLTDPGFNFTILMSQKFIDFIKNELFKALKDSEDQLRKSVENIIVEIKKIDKLIEDHANDLENAKKAVLNAQQELSALDSGSLKVETEINQWKAKVSGLQNEVDSANLELEKLNKEKYSFWNVKNKLIKESKIKYFQSKILGLKASIKLANGILEELFKKSAIGTLKLSKQLAQESLEVANKGLSAIKAIDISTLKVAKASSIKTLELLAQSGVGVLKGTDFVFKGILSGFNVSEVKFESNLDKIKSGELFNLFIVMDLLGKRRNFETKFNLRDIKNSVYILTQEVVNKLIPTIK